MAKKKNPGKKHKFKHTEPSSVQTDVVKERTSAGSAPRATVLQTAGGATQRDFSYVAGDLKRIAVMAVGLVVLEVAIWYLFAHTGVGNTAYNLIKV